MRKPKRLRPGDLIAVVAPAGAVESAQLEPALEFLRESGFRVRLGEHVYSRKGYLAGTDQERAQDLQSAWCDPQVAAVIAARGGYGCTRLLPLLDVPSLVRQRKIFLGFSDCTALLNDMVCRWGQVAFHGPVATALAYDRDAARRALAALSGGCTRSLLAPRVLREGCAEGRLLGGCLSVLVALLGTKYEPSWEGAVLFVEDVNEKPYRIDRMLTHLKQAGVLQRLRALVFGEMTGCSAGSDESWSVWDVIEDHAKDFPGPVIGGLESGHGSGREVLPLGVRARVERDRLILLESPFADERDG